MSKVMRYVKLFIPAIFAACFATTVLAANIVTVTAATGGGAISNSTLASGTWTALSGPSLAEQNPRGIGAGSIVLNVPAGFIFNTAASVTVAVTHLSGNSGADLTLSGPTATVSATTITITVASQSTGSTLDKLSWSGIQVMPTACSPLAAGNITKSGTSTYNESSTNYGTLTETGSTALSFIQQPSNALVNAAISPAVTVSACGNGSTLPVVTVALTAAGGATLSGTLTATTSNTTGLATFGNLSVNLVGTYTLTASSPGLTSAVSSSFVISNIAVSNFNAFESSTAAGATTGVIYTKIAGSAFSLDVVAISVGAQAISFTGAVKVELLGNTVTGVALDAKNCPTSFTLLQTVSPNPTITGGRSVVNFAAVADAWKDVRVRISYPATSPTVIACSTDNFAIRPNSLSVIITDTDWQTAGITARTLNNSAASGGVVHKAGQPFTIRATAYNAAGVITGNYTGSPSALPIACTLPAPTCTNGTLTPGAWTAAGGTVTSTIASYSEAGSFNLTLQDTTFASVDAGDGTPATCAGYYVCSAAVSVGRFVPDHFVVTASNVPQLKTFNNAACAVRSFTYIGQPFGYVTAPQVLVTAQNAANAATANYTSNLWKLATAAGVQNCTTNPNPDTCTLTSGSVKQTYTYTATPAATPNWDNAQVVIFTPTIVAGTNGTGTVTSASTDLLAFKRSLTGPQTLFTVGITLTDSATDSSEAGNCGVANCDITTLTPAAFNPIAFDSGNEFRYGRLKLGNALGSELLNLPIPIQTQYWNGSAFVINTADNCTALAANNVNLSAPPAGVSATVGAFASGVGSLTLSPPTAAAKVAVNLCVDLGADPVGGTVCAAATSANLNYLQGLWAPGSSYNNDPGALATFGVYKGANEFIYLRENY
jgi:hypothetical protein